MTANERLDRHDKQIAAIRSLVQEGMRLMVETRKDIRKLAGMQIATAAAQQKTEASLKGLIRSLRGGGNVI
jgi:hypothetical protein